MFSPFYPFVPCFELTILLGAMLLGLAFLIRLHGVVPRGNVTLLATDDAGGLMVRHRSDQWIKDLAKKDLFAVRSGVLKFRGYKPKQTPVNPIGQLTDADFSADFEQKGVDMRIGLDIASYSAGRVAGTNCARIQ